MKISKLYLVTFLMVSTFLGAKKSFCAVAENKPTKLVNVIYDMQKTNADRQRKSWVSKDKLTKIDECVGYLRLESDPVLSKLVNDIAVKNGTFVQPDENSKGTRAAVTGPVCRQFLGLKLDKTQDYNVLSAICTNGPRACHNLKKKRLGISTVNRHCNRRSCRNPIVYAECKYLRDNDPFFKDKVNNCIKLNPKNEYFSVDDLNLKKDTKVVTSGGMGSFNLQKQNFAIKLRSEFKMPKIQTNKNGANAAG